jgi:hypothetical protein
MVPSRIVSHFLGDNLIEAERLKIPVIVAKEATKKTDSIARWVKKHQKDNPSAFVDLDGTIQTSLRAISGKYPLWTARGRNQADPIVVASAHALSLIVVTGEHPSIMVPLVKPNKQHKMKIPNVCDEFKVRWIGIPDLIKHEGWSF